MRACRAAAGILRRLPCWAPWLLALAALPVQGREAVDQAVIDRLMEESLERSQAADTIRHLSDLYGPRLTGTPRYAEMAAWVEGRLRSWGIGHVRRESFGEGLRGWKVAEHSAAMTRPVFMRLNAQPICCGRSTYGRVSSPVLAVDFYDLDALQEHKGALQGKILLHPELTPEYDGVRGRWSDAALQRAAKRLDPVTADGLDGPGSKISFVERLKQQAEQPDRSGERLAQFLIDEGVAALLRSSAAPAGLVSNRFDASLVAFHRIGEPRPRPLFVIPREQHARLLALLELGAAPEVALSLTANYYQDPELHFNLIAELPGADPQLQEQVVYLGAHLDSVAMATGASDNGVGVAASMEVLRMFVALDLKPRRTVRLGLWGGEEKGLLGARAYVRRHYGDILAGEFNSAQQRVSAYFNHDNNGHDIRGIFLLGHEAIRPIFQAFLNPFADWGAATVTIENAGGTDILVFDAAGIPSFEWIHDPRNYFSHQLHTNLDAPTLVDVASVQRNAAIIASLVYHTAMRDEMLPRKPRPQGPAAPDRT